MTVEPTSPPLTMSSITNIRCQGVCLGSGIGNLEELYNTSIAYHEAVSLSATALLPSHYSSNLMTDE